MDINNKKNQTNQDWDKSAISKPGSTEKNPVDYVQTMKDDLGQTPKGGPTRPETQPPAPPRPAPSPPRPPSFKKAGPPQDLPIVESARKEEKAKPRPIDLGKGAKRPAVLESILEKKQEPEIKRSQLAKKLAERQKASAAKLSHPTSNKKLLIGLVVLAIIVGLGIFVYWWNYLRVPSVAVHYQCENGTCLAVEGQGDDQCIIDADCQAQPPTLPLPQSLIETDQTKVIKIESNQPNILLNKMAELVSQDQARGSLWRILVKSVDEEGNEKYLNLEELALALDLKFSSEILASNQQAGSQYDLLLYQQAEGKRWAMVLAIQPEDNLGPNLIAWETEMKIINDLKPLIGQKVLEAITEEFQENNYQEKAVIRYMNFPSPDLSLDYALIGSKLVLATSRESMFKLVDLLIEPAEASSPEASQ